MKTLLLLDSQEGLGVSLGSSEELMKGHKKATKWPVGLGKRYQPVYSLPCTALLQMMFACKSG